MKKTGTNRESLEIEQSEIESEELKSTTSNAQTRFMEGADLIRRNLNSALLAFSVGDTVKFESKLEQMYAVMTILYNDVEVGKYLAENPVEFENFSRDINQAIEKLPMTNVKYDNVGKTSFKEKIAELVGVIKGWGRMLLGIKKDSKKEVSNISNAELIQKAQANFEKFNQLAQNGPSDKKHLNSLKALGYHQEVERLTKLSVESQQPSEISQSEQKGNDKFIYEGVEYDDVPLVVESESEEDEQEEVKEVSNERVNNDPTPSVQVSPKSQINEILQNISNLQDQLPLKKKDFSNIQNLSAFVDSFTIAFQKEFDNLMVEVIINRQNATQASQALVELRGNLINWVSDLHKSDQYQRQSSNEAPILNASLNNMLDRVNNAIEEAELFVQDLKQEVEQEVKQEVKQEEVNEILKNISNLQDQLPLKNKDFSNIQNLSALVDSFTTAFQKEFDNLMFKVIINPQNATQAIQALVELRGNLINWVSDLHKSDQYQDQSSREAPILNASLNNMLDRVNNAIEEAQLFVQDVKQEVEQETVNENLQNISNLMQELPRVKKDFSEIKNMSAVVNNFSLALKNQLDNLTQKVMISPQDAAKVNAALIELRGNVIIWISEISKVEKFQGQPMINAQSLSVSLNALMENLNNAIEEVQIFNQEVEQEMPESETSEISHDEQKGNDKFIYEGVEYDDVPLVVESESEEVEQEEVKDVNDPTPISESVPSAFRVVALQQLSEKAIVKPSQEVEKSEASAEEKDDHSVRLNGS